MRAQESRRPFEDDGHFFGGWDACGTIRQFGGKIYVGPTASSNFVIMRHPFLGVEEIGGGDTVPAAATSPSTLPFLKPATRRLRRRSPWLTSMFELLLWPRASNATVLTSLSLPAIYAGARAPSSAGGCTKPLSDHRAQSNASLNCWWQNMSVPCTLYNTGDDKREFSVPPSRPPPSSWIFCHGLG